MTFEFPLQYVEAIVVAMIKSPIGNEFGEALDKVVEEEFNLIDKTGGVDQDFMDRFLFELTYEQQMKCISEVGKRLCAQ